MAFSNGLNLRVMVGGADGSTGNGGGFDTGVAGFAANGAATNANTTAPVFTSASYTFVAGDVGAWVFIKSGTNWIPGWYKITSVAAGAATLDAAIGHATLYPGGGLNTLGGCATTASPTVATWGLDYSLQTAAQITFIDLVIDAVTATDFTSAGFPVGYNMIGNIVAVSSGTGFTVQRIAIASIVSGVIGRADKSLGTLGSTGGKGKLGGAVATPGQAGALQVASSITWWKYNATPFNTTSTASNVANGRILMTAGAAGLPTRIRGYDQIHGDETANRPTMKWGVNAVTGSLITIPGTNARTSVENLILSGDKAGGWTATSCAVTGNGGNFTYWRRVKFTSTKNTLFTLNNGQNGNLFIDCEFTDCDVAAITNPNTGESRFIHCDIHDNLGHGVTVTGNLDKLSFIGCIFDTNKNGAVSSHINITGADEVFCDSCIFYNSGADAFISSAAGYYRFINSLFESNGGYMLNLPASFNDVEVINCGGYNNTSGKSNATGFFEQGDVSQSAGSYFVDAVNRDFTPNATAGQGMLLRNAGYPATIGISSQYRDIGTIQHEAPTPYAIAAATWAYANRTVTA